MHSPSRSRAALQTAPTLAYRFPQGSIRQFGEWLVRRGLIDRAELFLALDVSFRYGCRLGDALVWLELLDRGCVEREARRFHAFRPDICLVAPPGAA